MKKISYLLLLIGLLNSACSESTTEEIIPTEPDTETEPTPSTDVFVPGKYCVLLDITQRNGDDENGSEAGRNLYSAKYILELAGIPFKTVTNFSEALENGSMILFSSPITDKTFTENEWEELNEWVKEGGTVVSPALANAPTVGMNLFGISESNYNKSRYFYQWNSQYLNEKELKYADEPEEQLVSLANAKGSEGATSLKSYGYTVSDAEILASFDTGEAAVTRHALGKGYAYSFGVLWRDVIQRSQLNKDFSASRNYSNAFEPSADVYSFFIRSLYGKLQDVSVWKFTVPGGYQSLLIPTHDCDSRTSYDEMHYLSSYEKSLGLRGHYFLTVHYYRAPSYMSAFYDEISIKQSLQLLEDGHTIGSHSIGHFPDFSKTERFPITVVTKDEYQPRHDIKTGVTTGGSTWAEIALSRQIIEEDLGNEVKSFRTGHLTMNKNIPVTLKDAGYLYSSCYSAGDLLSEFPFFERIGNAWEGELSPVLQMPLHISDVINSDPINEDNWHEKPDLWLKVINKLKGNYAASIILIHPNREWKMQAQKLLIEKMDRNEIGLYNFEEYGDFWTKRHLLDFEHCYLKDKDKLLIQVDNLEMGNKAYVFGIDCQNGKTPREVILMDKNKKSINLKVKQISTERYIAYL